MHLKFLSLQTHLKLETTLHDIIYIQKPSKIKVYFIKKKRKKVWTCDKYSTKKKNLKTSQKSWDERGVWLWNFLFTKYKISHSLSLTQIDKETQIPYLSFQPISLSLSQNLTSQSLLQLIDQRKSPFPFQCSS